MIRTDRPDRNGGGVEYDAELERYRAVVDREGEDSASATVVEAVSTATDTSPDELPRLYEAIEPDSLDRLIRHARASELTHTGNCVAFGYAGCDVTVYWDGCVVVVPPAGE